MDNLQETRRTATRGAKTVADKLFSYQTWGLGLGVGSIERAAATATKNVHTMWSGKGTPPSASDLIGQLRVTEVRPNEKQDLYPRPFSTTPGLGNGNGPVNRDTETRLLVDGPTIRKTKDVGSISNHIGDFWRAPLIQDRIDDLNNEHHWIAEANGLSRSGAVTRGAPEIK